MRPYLVLAVLCLLVYGRTLGHELLVWDDTAHIVDNIYLNPPSFANLARFWTASFWGLYIPVAYSAWWLLAQFARPTSAPWAYHLLNLALHFANGVLVYEIISLALPTIKKTKPGWPLAGAALFILHPLQVETVAWASGMRDLLGTALAFTALLFFLKKKSPWRGLLLFGLALLAKPSVIVAPAFAYLLLPREERHAKRLRPLVGWLIAGTIVFVITKVLQPDDAIVGLGPLWQRPWVAGDALAFYARMLVVPYPLSADYGASPPWRAQFASFWILGTLAWIALAAAYRGRHKLPALELAIFVVGVAPVLGLFAFSFQDYSTVSDRYVYFAMLGVALAYARVFEPRHARLTQGLAVAWLVVLTAVGVARVPDWATNQKFFHATLATNPRSYGALNNLAMLAHQHRDPATTLDYAQRALTLRPDMQPAQVNVENALKDLHRYPELAAHYRAVLRQRPRDPYPRSNLCVALDALGDKAGALTECLRAAELKPDLPAARYNSARLLLGQGRTAEAAPHLDWMDRNQPDFPGFRELKR